MSLIRASYTVNRGQAYAGQIADTSLYNIDGTCAYNDEATANLPIGVLVSATGAVVDGHKVVATGNAAGQTPLGIAVMSHAYSPTGEYEPGRAVNVMTHGRVWVLALVATADADLAFDKFISFNAAGIVATDGAVKTGWKSTGEILPSEDSRYKLVKVQVLQSAVAPAAAE